MSSIKQFKQYIVDNNNLGSWQDFNFNVDMISGLDTKIDKAISEIVGSAPENLDTLQEIATWIQDDDSGATKLIEEVRTIEANYVNLTGAQTIDGYKLFTGSGSATVKSNSTLIGNNIRCIGNPATNVATLDSSGLRVAQRYESSPYDKVTKYGFDSIRRSVTDGSVYIDLLLPPEGGTLATREWVNSQNFGSDIDTSNFALKEDVPVIYTAETGTDSTTKVLRVYIDANGWLHIDTE